MSVDTRAGGPQNTIYSDGGSNISPNLDMAVEIPKPTHLEPQTPENALIARAIRRVWDMEEARYAPYGARALESWDLYHQTWNDDDKDNWQSRIRYPLYMMAVERLTSVIIQLLEMTPNWFECESLVPQHQVFVDLARRFTSFLIEHDNTRFRSKLAEAIRSGLLTGQLHCMVVFEKEGIEQFGQDKALGEMGMGDADALGMFRSTPGGDKPFIPNPDLPKLRLEVMPSRDVRGDATGLKRYKIWQRRVPIGYLYDQSTARGFDKEACERAIRASSKSELARGAALENLEKNQGASMFPQDRLLLLTFFEGSLPHPDNGDIIFKEKFAVCAENEVVYEPQDTPWWDGERAIVSAPFVPVPHAIYGKSPLTENLDAFHTQLNIINLMIDYCQQVVYGMWEVDKDKLETEQQRFDLKIYPGAVFYTENNPSGQPVIKRVPPPEPQAGFFNFFEIFRQTLDMTTGMNNIGGSPRARGRMTGMEAMAKNAEGGSLFKSIFEEIERNFLAPILRLAMLRGLQFCTDAMWSSWVKIETQSIMGDPNKAVMDPNLAQVWQTALTEAASWDARERFKRLGNFMRFKVRIFSNLSERQMEIEKGGFFLEQVGRIPGAMQYIRMDVLLRYMTRALGWDPDKILKLDILPSPAPTTDGTGFSEWQEPGASESSSVPDFTAGIYDMFNQADMQQQQQMQGGMQPPQPGGMPPQMQNGPIPGIPGNPLEPKSAIPNPNKPPPGPMRG